MYVAGACNCGGSCGPCRGASSSGLGFPIVPIALMGGSALIKLFSKKKCPAKMSEADAKSIVRQTFLELLEREPDYPGAQGYVDCLLKRNKADCENTSLETGDQCAPEDLRINVLASDEYRRLQMKKAASVYSPMGTSADLPFAGAGGFDVGGALSGGIGGIPFTWIAVGLGLVLLMKR